MFRLPCENFYCNMLIIPYKNLEDRIERGNPYNFFNMCALISERAGEHELASYYYLKAGKFYESHMLKNQSIENEKRLSIDNVISEKFKERILRKKIMFHYVVITKQNI